MNMQAVHIVISEPSGPEWPVTCDHVQTGVEVALATGVN